MTLQWLSNRTESCLPPYVSSGDTSLPHCSPTLSYRAGNSGQGSAALLNEDEGKSQVTFKSLLFVLNGWERQEGDSVVPSRSQELGTSGDRCMHMPFFFCSSLSNTQPAFIFFTHCDRFMKMCCKDTPISSLKAS